jgi:GNAT superfamily N-acetyltransferase
MFSRLPGAEFERRSARSKRAALRRLVDKSDMPGLLAYRAGEPIGWCSGGPQRRFKRLQRSSVLQTTDEIPVWSIVCFYIAPEHRSEGVASALLDAAVRDARKKGAKVIEATQSTAVPAGAAIARPSRDFSRCSSTAVSPRWKGARKRDPILRRTLRRLSGGGWSPRPKKSEHDDGDRDDSGDHQPERRDSAHERTDHDERDSDHSRRGTLRQPKAGGEQGGAAERQDEPERALTGAIPLVVEDANEDAEHEVGEGEQDAKP